MIDIANTEAVTLAKATALGVRLPAFTKSEFPALWCAWADRVAIADLARSRGKLTDGDRAACDVLISLPALVPATSYPEPSRAVPGYPNLFRFDPMAGIAEAVRSFNGVEA